MISQFRCPGVPVNPFVMLASVWLVVCQARAADWPTLRGPDNNSISRETAWKAERELPVIWRAEVGLGYSAVVVADGRAFTLGHDGDNTDTLWAFDAASGKVLWKHSYSHPLDDRYFQGGTTGTPTVDGEVIYSLARRGQLFCLDAASGALKWQKHLAEDFGCEMPDWGFTGAPCVFGDSLLLTAGEAGIALNKKDGSLQWQSDGDEKAGYSTPKLFQSRGRDRVLFSSKSGYFCVDPKSGEKLWFYKHKTRYGVNASEPVILGNHILISTGYGKGAVLLRWDGTEDPEEIWYSREMANQMNPGIFIDGHLYGISGNAGQDRTGLKCLVVATGEVRWLEESVGHGALIAADKRLIVLTEKGELQVSPVSPERYHPTFKQQVVGPECWTIPVLSKGLIYCRNSKGEIAVVDAR